MRQKLLICSGEMNSCRVHGTGRRVGWNFLGSPDTLQLLLDALNPRGFREFELLENMRFLKPRLNKMVETFADVWEKNGNQLLSDDWRTKGRSPQKNVEDFMEETVRESLRDLEEKVQSGGIGLCFCYEVQ